MDTLCTAHIYIYLSSDHALHPEKSASTRASAIAMMKITVTFG
jgi:hypothetical protein